MTDSRPRDFSVPASIWYKNPGAMWGNPLAVKWGADKKAVTLADGKGQGNNIASFPTFVQGICAQLDLWRSSKNYKNKRFADAIAIWSGHNSVQQYIDYCKRRVPGLSEDTIMNDTFWRSPMGIAFLKAQAGHEAGKTYPAPEGDWIEAQKRVFSSIPTPNTVKKATAIVVASTAAPTIAAAAHGGFNYLWLVLASAVIALIILLIWKFRHSSEAKSALEMPHPALVDTVAVAATVPGQPIVKEKDENNGL